MAKKKPIEDKKFPSELAERFQIRMPNGLRDRIRAAAEENNRSMNSEILLRLEQTFETTPTGQSLIAEMAALKDMVLRIDHSVDLMKERHAKELAERTPNK